MTAEYTPPGGNRYSQLFIERYRGQSDSKKLRKRIICLFDQEFGQYENMVQEIGQTVQRRLGVDLQYNHFHGNPMLTWFFTDCEIAEVNDAITVIAEVMKLYEPEFCDKWLKEVNEIFIEEGMPYRIDGMVVVPYIDEAFSHAQVTLLKGLKEANLDEVRQNVADAFKHIRKPDADGCAAIKSIHAALECYLMTKVEVSGLSDKGLTIELLKKLEEGGAETNVSQHMLQSFSEWVKAAEWQKDQDASIDIAVLIVDQSVGFLRWFLGVLED